MTLWEIRPPFCPFLTHFLIRRCPQGSPIIRNHRLVKIQNTRSGSHIFWKGAIYWCPKVKGHMNKKLIFFLFLFYLYQTLEGTNLRDLGKDFSSQALIERNMIKIRAFPKTSTKTFLKWPRDKMEEMETTFGLWRHSCWASCWSVNVMVLRRAIPIFLLFYKITNDRKDLYSVLSDVAP